MATINGTVASDAISGTAFDDQIFGLDGNDFLIGGPNVNQASGNDEIHGGTGNDAIYGFDGNDKLYGDAGDDSGVQNFGNTAFQAGLFGGAGNDMLYGGSGNDFLDGATGTDTAVFEGKWDQFQWSINQDGSLTVTDLRVGSPEGTDSVTGVEVLEFDYGPDPSGGTATKSYDVGNAFAWSFETRTYDAQGTASTVFTKMDAGQSFYTDYNLDHADPWNAAVTTYDAQDRLLATSIYKDVTLVTTYDAAGDQSWSQAITGYDAQGRRDYVTVVNDDHSSLYTKYSYSGDIDYSIYTYDAQNHLTQSYIHHTNGTADVIV